MTPQARPRLSARTRVATAVGRATGSLVRRVRRTGGSVIGARVTLALAPNALEELAVGRRTAIVSGTNGKSTTTAMLAAMCEAAGYSVASNVEGANLRSGVVTVLSVAADDDVAVLEIDELALPALLPSFESAVVVLLNLSRDQLDRFGEVRTVAASWRKAFAARGDVVAVANADDPLVVWAAQAAARSVFVGAGHHWRLDSATCPECGGRIVWSDESWHCDACSLRRPPALEIAGGSLMDGTRQVAELRPGVPGRHNVGNAAEALLGAMELGIEPVVAADALTRVTSVFGRYRTVELAGTTARLLLAKNPAGWGELLALIEDEDVPVLLAINARIADGKDPSWLWDVDFEQLAGRRVTAAGERAADLAVRLHYAEVDTDVHRGPLVDRIRSDTAERLDVLANYTAFADLVRDLP